VPPALAFASCSHDKRAARDARGPIDAIVVDKIDFEFFPRDTEYAGDMVAGMCTSGTAAAPFMRHAADE
jgi:hypothetical protein